MEPKYYRVMKEADVSFEGQGNLRLCVGEYLVEPAPGNVYVSGLGGVRPCDSVVEGRVDMFDSLVADGTVIKVPKLIRKQEWFLWEVVKRLEYKLAYLNESIARVEKDLQKYYAGIVVVLPMHHVLWDNQKRRTCHVIAIADAKKQIDALFQMRSDEWKSFVFEGDFLDRTRIEDEAGRLVENAARSFSIKL